MSLPNPTGLTFKARSVPTCFLRWAWKWTVRVLNVETQSAGLLKLFMGSGLSNVSCWGWCERIITETALKPCINNQCVSMEQRRMLLNYLSSSFCIIAKLSLCCIQLCSLPSGCFGMFSMRHSKAEIQLWDQSGREVCGLFFPSLPRWLHFGKFAFSADGLSWLRRQQIPCHRKKNELSLFFLLQLLILMANRKSLSAWKPLWRMQIGRLLSRGNTCGRWTYLQWIGTLPRCDTAVSAFPCKRRWGPLKRPPELKLRRPPAVPRWRSASLQNKRASRSEKHGGAWQSSVRQSISTAETSRTRADPLQRSLQERCTPLKNTRNEKGSKVTSVK